MCHDLFWLSTAPCRPGTDMMTCVSKQTCLAAQSVGMPVSGSEYTWYDLAFGPCQWPLAWLPAVPSSLAGNKMDWARGRVSHHSEIVWLSATLKDRQQSQLSPHTWRQEAPGITALHHPVTVPGTDHEQDGNRTFFSCKGILHVSDWQVSQHTEGFNVSVQGCMDIYHHRGKYGRIQRPS